MAPMSLSSLRPVGAAFALLLPALSGCLSNGGTSPKLIVSDLGPLQSQEGISLQSGDRSAGAVTAAGPDPIHEQRNDLPSPDASALADTAGSQDRETLESNAPNTQSNSISGTGTSGTGATDQNPVSSGNPIVTGRQGGGRSLAERPRNNPTAADLLDHWGHRRVQSIVEGLSLSTDAPEADGAGLKRLRAATEAPEGASPTPSLHEDDEVQILGSRRGVTYGRWTGGPADTLSIEFDLSQAGPALRDDPEIRGMIERAGKVWSRRIADTWSVWRYGPGAAKGTMVPGFKTITAGPNGETSTGLEIIITDGVGFGAAGRAQTDSRISPREDSWEPRFGSIELNREHIDAAEGANVFSTVAHEIGHVLGAWKGDDITARYADYVDRGKGTWTGPGVIAVHGGPAPFQNQNDPQAWVNGERDPLASQYDFAHSGVCKSLMSYCTFNAALPAFLPHELDFAFLADLGMTIREDSDRPETYGLAGWTDYAAFTVSVSRDLQVKMADPQPYFDAWGNIWQTLDVTDLLQVGVDVFGFPSTGDIHRSYPAAGPDGTVHYAGGLLGTAIDRGGLPPVTGDANLAVDLGTLDGSASFTALKVYTQGTPDTFASGALHYPFEVSDNAILGTETGSTLLADFYGPRHEDIAGMLHDPRAGLLASFGASHDDRPRREEVVASADYMAGITFSTERFSNSDGSRYDEHRWHQYRCEPDCQIRSVSGGHRDWMPADEATVLSSTAGWDRQSEETLDADHDFVRVTRSSQGSTDGARGRHVADNYAGTLNASAFSTGFENYANWLAEPRTESLNNLRNVWSGVQGTMTDAPLNETAGWSGKMLGYQQTHGAYESPFVEGLATVKFSLSDNSLDVAFSEIASRDGKREVADFGFADLRLEDNGTFSLWNATGIVSGALFGASHAEASGSFNHNPTHIIGSFGAHRLPDTVTLEESGAVTYEEKPLTKRYHFDDWGVWAEQFSQDVFGAFIDQNMEENSLFPGTFYPGEPFGRIEGTPTGHNPVAGGAVWLGVVRAFEAGSGIVSFSDVNYTPVSGRARLEVDFADVTADVDFTDFEAGYGDMSWRALQLHNGAFRHGQISSFLREGDAIEGAFYGDEHQGVAGTFERDGLKGVFGAVATEE